MNVRLRPVLALRLVAGCAMVASVTACSGSRSFEPDRVTVTELEPQSYYVYVEPADPLVIDVLVPWTRDGWCFGQFTAETTETPTEVHIGTVTSEEHSRGVCLDVGTHNNVAPVHVTLSSPLGDRPVIRASDGARLPRTGE